MNSVIITDYFKRQIKPLTKKYPNCITELIVALHSLSVENTIHLKHNLYKIRLGNKSTNQGKSGAFRVIALIIPAEMVVVPIIMYHKSAQSNISKRTIAVHAQAVNEELKALHMRHK